LREHALLITTSLVAADRPQVSSDAKAAMLDRQTHHCGIVGTSDTSWRPKNRR
jgi:hypothetical protein